MNRRALPSVLLLSFALIPFAILAAQENQNQTCSVPLVVSHFAETTRHIEYVKGLGVKDVSVRIGGKVITPQSVVVDASPKRVAIIFDASNEVSELEWKMAMEIAAHMVQIARPDDRFALLVTGTSDSAGEWISGAQAAQQFKTWAFARPASDRRGERNFDALMAAVKLLNPPQFGDTVFLFGHPRDKGSKATSEQVQEELLKKGVRLNGITFVERPQVMWINVREDQHLFDIMQMSQKTGSSFLSRDLRLLAKPEELQALKTLTAEWYTGIAEPYRVTFSPPPLKKRTNLEIDVRDAKGRKFGSGEGFYASAIYPCGGSSN